MNRLYKNVMIIQKQSHQEKYFYYVAYSLDNQICYRKGLVKHAIFLTLIIIESFSTHEAWIKLSSPVVSHNYDISILFK